MEDWSDILSPMQWSKAIKLPVIVYKENNSGIFPIAGLNPAKLVEKTRVNDAIHNSAKARRVITPNLDLSVHLQRNKTDPGSKRECLIPKNSTQLRLQTVGISFLIYLLIFLVLLFCSLQLLSTSLIFYLHIFL